MNLGSSDYIMISDNSVEKLVDQAAALVAAAKRAGADQADAVVMRARAVSVSVRLGKIEGTDRLKAMISLCAFSWDVALQVFRPMLAPTPTALPSEPSQWRVLRRKIPMNN